MTNCSTPATHSQEIFRIFASTVAQLFPRFRQRFALRTALKTCYHPVNRRQLWHIRACAFLRHLREVIHELKPTLFDITLLLVFVLWLSEKVYKEVKPHPPVQCLISN